MKKPTLATLSALLLLGTLAEASEENITVDQLLKDSAMVTGPIAANRHFWLSAGAISDWRRFGVGAQLDVGYRLQYFGIDARYSFGKTQYGAISVNPGASQLPGDAASFSDSDTELNRPRNDSDSWNYRSVEPGLSVSGRLFPQSLPLLTEQGRVGIAFGTYNDATNGVAFTSLVLATDFTLLCQLGARSPWSITTALSFNSGILIATAPEDASQQQRRLPISWVGTAIGLQYSF